MRKSFLIITVSCIWQVTTAIGSIRWPPGLQVKRVYSGLTDIADVLAADRQIS